MKDRRYVCIDLKSFFASVECVERGLDPFKVNLVVADPDRTAGTVCLAITPAMKALGIRNRCRIFEIPKNVEYIVAKPRMKLYMKKSAEIYSIYLKYISPDDIHVYSIDECFIDITDYMKLYDKTDIELGKFLAEEVFRITGIRATVGVGTNLFLAKVALDITAKHSPEFVGYLDENSFKKEIWFHKPITDIWNIGNGTANKLAKFGVHDLYGVAHTDEKLLYKLFGINAELLIDHANGIEPCTIKDIHEYKRKSMSISNSQILFKDYNKDEAFIVIKEMIESLTLEMIEKSLVTDSVFVSVSYKDREMPSTGGSKRLKEYTNSLKKITEYIKTIYYKTTLDNETIKKVGVGLCDLKTEDYKTIDLLTDVKAEEKENKVLKTVIQIKKKFGKNAILRGISFEEKATARERNKMVGGHNGGEDD